MGHAVLSAFHEELSEVSVTELSGKVTSDGKPEVPLCRRVRAPSEGK